MGDEADMDKAFHDRAWSSRATRDYVEKLRGFRAEDYEGSEPFEDMFLHRYRGTSGNEGFKTFLLRSTPKALHEEYGPVEGYVSGHDRGQDGFHISTTVVHPAHQGKGLATKLYRHLLSRYGAVHSDSSVSPGARKLWESLARHPDLDVTVGKPETAESNVLRMKKSDESHGQALRETGFWGRQGAGAIIYARDTGRFLLPHRSEEVEQPHTWGTWGGAIDAREHPAQAAHREIQEEMGYDGPVDLHHVWTFKHPSGFQYHNFIGVVDHEFEPNLNWETQAHAWVAPGEWPQPLHFGLKNLVERPEFHKKLAELQGKWAIKKSLLPALQKMARINHFENPKFREWFEGSKVVDEYEQPKMVFHGTTHGFKHFDPKVRGNPENFLGRGNYFTDAHEDVNENYAGEGPDLETRIEEEKERVLNELHFDSPAGADVKALEERAYNLAREKLVGPAPRVIPAFLRMRNPVIYDRWGGTSIESEKMYRAVHAVAPRFGYDPHDLVRHLDCAPGGFTWGAQQWDEKLRSYDKAFESTDDEGRFRLNEFIAGLWQHMGHDGVIMDASRFRGMHGTSGTKHYIAFKPTQVKSPFAQEFNPRSKDFGKSEEDDLQKSWKALAAAATLAIPGTLATTPRAQASYAPAPARVVVEDLHPHLQAISHLETSGGRFLNHAAHSKGDYHTAYGAVGLKPVTAHEVWQRTPKLQRRFPGLENPNAFVQAFKKFPGLYNAVANQHWSNLLRAGQGDPQRAAFAWRWGRGALGRANPAQVAGDGYVTKFASLVAPSEVMGKNEHLDRLYERAVAQRKQHGAKSSAWRHPQTGQVVPGKGFIHDPADLDGHDPDALWERGYILNDGGFLDAETFDSLGTWKEGFRNFGKSESFSFHDQVIEPWHLDHAKLLLAYNDAHDTALEAARFLTGRRHPIDHDMFRLGLSVYGGSVERAALVAVGLSPSEENIRALRAAVQLGDFSKAEQELRGDVNINSVQPGAPEAEETADAVRRAVSAGLVQPLSLKGKHSSGAMVVRDPQTGLVILLKPGSGRQSPARGARDGSSSQSAREAAYWHCAKVMGMQGYIPRADLLLVNSQQWAAIRFLDSHDWKSLDEKNREVDGYAREVLQPYLARGDIHRLAAVAWILGDPDSHGQNWLAGHGAVANIDHGSAFAGENFDPGDDRKSFTPYPLRVFASREYPKLAPAERVKTMPVLDKTTDDSVKEWVMSIDAGMLDTTMQQYGLGEPERAAVLARLSGLQRHAGNVSEYLNGLWAGTTS